MDIFSLEFYERDHDGMAEKGKLKKFWKKFNKYSGAIALVITIAGVIYNIGGFGTSFKEIKECVKENSTQLRNINESIIGLQDGQTNLTERVSRIERHEDEVLSLHLAEDAAIEVEPVGSSGLHFASWQNIDEDVTIGTDEYNNSYTIKDIAGKTVFLPYENKENTLLFYGQLSANQNWDGCCTLNAYQNGKLQFVSVAQFNDGNLISYKQVFWSNEKNAWYCSERQVYETGNYGYTKQYPIDFQYDLGKSIDKIQKNDILDCSYILGKVDYYMSGFYWGYTTDSLYNDQTGDAYLIKFDKDGYVTYLYVGQFTDGKPNDQTGNAWMIGQNEYGEYLYYQGKFDNDKKTDDRSHWEKLEKLDSIEEKINGYSFQCDLKWRGF